MTNLTDTSFRTLVGAALCHPPFASFVGIALDKREMVEGPLRTVAIAIAYNDDHGAEGGVAGAAERLAHWGELERVGGLDALLELAALRPELETKLSELQMFLDGLPPIEAEPVVRTAAEMFGAKPIPEVALDEPATFLERDA